MRFKKLATAAASGVIAASALTLRAGAAHADGTMPTLTQGASSAGFGGGPGAIGLTASFNYSTPMPAGATVTASVLLCDGSYATSPSAPVNSDQITDSSTSKWEVGGGDNSWVAFDYARYAGGIANPLHYAVTVSAPGYASETVIGGWTDPTHPTCSNSGSTSGNGSSTALVSSWSHKVKSNLKVGHSVSVSATHAAAGASVRYYWKVGAKTVKSGTSRALRIRAAYKGKTIKVVVKVVKGSRRASRTIGFGNARSASSSGTTTTSGTCPPGQHWAPGGGPFKVAPGCEPNMG